MTRHTPPIPTSPVRVGAFPDGPDTVLLNPEVPARRWRQQRIQAAARPGTVLTGLAGVMLIAAGVSSTAGVAAVLLLGLGGLTLGASVLIGWRRAARLVTGHDHRFRSCRVERVQGEFFFRSRDFRQLGRAGSGAVRALITCVDELHRTPARAWIDPALPGEAHRVVWEALCCLHRTRAARALAENLAAEPDGEADGESDGEVGELATAVRQAISAIDEGLSGVVVHLRGCVALTRAWEAKLRHAERAEQVEHALAALTDRGGIQAVLHTAEALPQTVFAYITAARDVTGAGVFPWEQPVSRWWSGRIWCRRPTPGPAARPILPGGAS